MEPLYITNPGKYTSYPIQPGDTIYNLAKVMYGNSDRWEFIVYDNDLNYPYTLEPGTLISLDREMIREAQRAPVANRDPITIDVTEYGGEQSPPSPPYAYPTQSQAPAVSQPWWRKNLHWLLLGGGAALVLLVAMQRR
jgi:hypothetical protein